MTSLQRTFVATAAAVAMFGLTSVAHADSVVFDGTNWTSTTDGSIGTAPNGTVAGGVSSSTSGGTTTLTSGAGGTNGVNGSSSGADFVTLATPITSNSGVWTLTATVNETVPATPAGSA